MASVEETGNMDSTTLPPPCTTSTYRHLKPSPLVAFNAVLMLVGSGGGSLLLRLYFVRGGHRMWLSTFLQVAAWPILLLPLYLSRLFLPTTTTPRRHHLLLPLPLAAASAFLGLLIALDCYLYAYGSSCLPLSTSSLLIASQLAFTAVFSFLIVRQRFTAFSLNAVVLLTLGPVVLSLGAAGDRPEGEAMSKYYVGFFMSIAAAALIGLVLPLVELAYRRMSTEEMTYATVIVTQIVMGASGSVFCLLGMLINKDFQAIPKEAKDFELGELKYYMVLIWNAICWQIINVGMVGVIFTASSLFCGVMIAILVPVGEILAVIFLNEKFNGSKGVALALCLWGFASYMYGEMKQSKKQKQPSSVELPRPKT
uniref:Probable purine permease n=1 Tax=Elaeis guineensis var. tenera TaxID=51953 RepID=A0A6I9RPK5_ELAGV|nr:purine permease 3 [Elaeis guineensis]